MLKFFRNLRRKLIKEGNLKKYLIYALGEILLVVIGILIAISLNNSNQDKIAKADLEKKLNKVREEIYNDSLRFEFISEFNRQRVETIQNLLRISEDSYSKENYQLLINFFKEDAARTKSGSPNSKTYMGLINSGEFSKIKDEALKEKISFLYFYYEHMSKLNYNSIQNIRVYHQELFSKGILSARYINDAEKENTGNKGFLYFQAMLDDSDKKIIFENYLYQEKRLSETIIRRNRQILDLMVGIPLKPKEEGEN